MNKLTPQDNVVGFPKKFTRYLMEDYFQTEVDDFDTGRFLFLSAKEVDIVTDDVIFENTEQVDEKGIIVSAYCYNYKRYMKMLIVNYKLKPWHNNFTVRRRFVGTMPIDDIAFHGTKEDYIEWMNIQPTKIKPNEKG
jgi:hypothetical protein